MAVSPFRSYHIATREDAADTLILQRERELSLLEKKWRGERKAARQRLLMTRIQATRNNIRSWRDYVAQGCPRVPNATTLVLISDIPSSKERKMPSYSIRIPGRVHYVLTDRDAFTSASEKETLAAFQSAVPKKFGRGTSWVIQGSSRGPLVEILDYIDSLYVLARDGVLPASELGGSAKVLQTVANQPVKASQ